MDREEMFGLVGREVVVGLNGAEVGGTEISGTLDEILSDGIVLSRVRDLVPGPTLFCPWESFREILDRPPWFSPPREEPGRALLFQVRERVEAETAPEGEMLLESLPQRRHPSARTLERVVPVAQRMKVGGITVAIASLELYGEGVGMLRWQTSFEEIPLRGCGNMGIPEPIFEIRDDSGRTLPWSPRGAGASDGEADGEAQVEELPDAGELEVRVTRLVSDAYEGGEYRGDGPSYEGPWTFRFTL